MTTPKKATRKPAAAAEGEVSVTLLREHTHAGEKLAAGDVIVVPAATAEWLRAQGVVGQAATTTEATTTED